MDLAYPESPVGRPTARRVAGLRLAAVAAGLVAYNVALNHVPFPAWAYVPANLALACGAALLAGRRWGLSAAELGLTRAAVLPGLLVAAPVVALGAVVVAAAPGMPWAEPLLSDRRVAGLAGTALASTVLLRIPLGTALPEELLFRGVLLAAYRRRTSEPRAVLAASLAFGLWHVGPGLVALEANRPGLGLPGTVLGVLAVVASTTLAGVLFCLLRRWGRGLLAPVVVHATVNAVSLMAAARFQA